MAETETTEKAPVNEETGEGTAKRTAGKQATKKTVKKKTAKTPAKGATKKAPVKKATKKTLHIPEGTKVVTNPGLKVGSTRLRLFKCLAKYVHGMSAEQVKKATGMAAKSGHLAVLLGEECDSGRIRFDQHEPQEGNRSIYFYFLTDKGKKDLKDGNIDKNKYAGHRIGQAWTKARHDPMPKIPGKYRK